MERQGAVFETPWPLRTNPHLDDARGQAVEWMRSFGLLQGESAVDDFVNWRLTEVAAYFYPDATVEDCSLAAQMMGWYFLPFDDQLDGDLGRDPQRVAGIAATLIGIVNHEVRPTAGSAPTIRAFADLWSRMSSGMSTAWQARLQYHWTSYFSSQVTEAMDRVDGFRYSDLDSYFSLRAATTCCFGQNDLGEKWGGIEVPGSLWHHPVLAEMRRLGADLVAIRNDSMSTAHEDLSGLHNTIFILEELNSCSRSAAVELASALAQDKVDRLVELEAAILPRLLRMLGSAERKALLGYADILHNWICGDYAWEEASTRNANHREIPDWAATLLVGDEK